MVNIIKRADHCGRWFANQTVKAWAGPSVPQAVHPENLGGRAKLQTLACGAGASRILQKHNGEGQLLRRHQQYMSRLNINSIDLSAILN